MTNASPSRSAVWCLALLLCAGTASPAEVLAQRPYADGFHASNADITRRGRQALTVCNGLFVSDRSVEQINEAELRGDPALESYLSVDRERRTVAVREGQGQGPVMRAVWREGIGCVVMSPEQTFADIDELPSLGLGAGSGDPTTIPWPDGDLIQDAPLPDDVDVAALEAAGDWTFDRVGHGGDPEEVTLSLLVVYRGRIVYERYAPGIDISTRTRTWSTAKSIASTLIGIAAGEGLLDLDAPLPFNWPPGELAELESRVARAHPAVLVEPFPPKGLAAAPDPRRAITLRHALNMSSGLYPQDNEYGQATGSSLSYWAGWNSAYQARDRGLVREPGTVWDYENYDTLLGVLALRTALDDERAYREYPRRALFDRIGMRNTVPGMDRFGNYVMSSQVYTNARDLARLGLLYLNGGRWHGEQIVPEWWVDFSRTAAPSTADFGNFYGGQWWLVPDARTDLPQDAYTTAGARGQHAIVIPSYDLVIVRRGLDDSGLPYWDMVAEVLKAFPERSGAAKRMPG
jgi:CubicO group peptidase (beta-lactamase class C family)